MLVGWILNLGKKLWLLLQTIWELIKALPIAVKKFRILDFKRTLKILSNLSDLVANIRTTALSIGAEFCFLYNIYVWAMEWIQLIQVFMIESVFISRMVYFSCLIFMGAFGLAIGFWAGVYKYIYINEASRNETVDLKERNILFFFFLVQVLFIDRFYKIFLENLPTSVLEANKVESYPQFPLKIVEQVDSPSLKIFNEPEKISLPFPFPIIEDPYLIETEILLDEKTDYQFQLFKFYEDVTQKKKVH